MEYKLVDIVSVLRYADDKAVVASTQKELQNLMDRLNAVTKKYGMKINVKKTKVMCISRTGNHKLKILVDSSSSGTGHTVQVSGQYYFQRWVL